MPLFYQHNINGATRLGVWKIEEDEPFFLNRVTLQRTISHPHKRLQHLAGRYLLQHLFPGFPYELIQIADTRKPFLSNDAYHFSISHCGDYAAAIVSTELRVGIDIEMVKPAIDKVRHKFVSNKELELLLAFQHLSKTLYEQLLTLCWSCKESVYKWYGEGSVDFKEHIQLVRLDGGERQEIMSQYLFKKEEPVPLLVHSNFFEGLVLSVVSS